MLDKNMHSDTLKTNQFQCNFQKMPEVAPGPLRFTWGVFHTPQAPRYFFN